MGLVCPKCGSEQVSVIDSRRKEGTVWRRRCCLCCQKRFNTVEISEERLQAMEKTEELMAKIKEVCGFEQAEI